MIRQVAWGTFLRLRSPGKVIVDRRFIVPRVVQPSRMGNREKQASEELDVIPFFVRA